MKVMPIIQSGIAKRGEEAHCGVISRAHKYLDKIGEIGIDNVKRMSEKSKKFLRENTPIRMKELAQLNCYAAEKIKTRLDMEYGENNYAIIAIGRSVSSMTELLKNMGVDSWIIPLSGLSFSIPWHREEEYFCIKDKSGKTVKIKVDNDCKSTLLPEQMEVYSKFLNGIGLSRGEIRKNPDKKYIVLDYAHTGRSLRNAHDILKDNVFLGDSPNIVKKSVNDLLGEDFYGMNFNALLNFERFKDYAYVGKMRVSNMGDVFKHANPEIEPEYQGNITKGLRKLFWFNVFDSYINKTYKKCSIEHEMKALYSHHLTQKALKIRNEIAINHFSNQMEDFKALSEKSVKEAGNNNDSKSIKIVIVDKYTSDSD